MAVRLVREEEDEAPQAQAPLPAPVALEPPPVVTQPPPVVIAPPAPEPAVDVHQAATIQAVGIMIALANILSVRFALLLTILCSAGLTLYAEAQPQRLEAVAAATLFSLLALIPMVALALRKG